VTPTKAVVLAQAQATSCGTFATGLPGPGLPPAPLLPVANRALVGHALRWLALGGVREAAMVVPHELADSVRRAAVGSGSPRLSWVEQSPGETLADSLRKLVDFLEGQPFVLHLADSLTRQSLRSVTAPADEHGLEALLVLDGSRPAELAQVVELRARRDRGRAGGVTPPADVAGVAVMHAGAIEAVAGLEAAPERILEALVERVQQHGGRVGTRSVSDWWRFRGGSDALLEGNRFALERGRANYTDAQVVNSSIQGAVIAHPQARIESCIVRGPAIVGAGAQLRNAYVGPYTSIGEDVLIDGTEIEYSVILPGASISHLAGRLEASVIGPKSKVFRDFRLPRALRLTLGEGAEVCLT
jgi:glucose-1-phosphate thymidylyltransferase